MSNLVDELLEKIDLGFMKTQRRNPHLHANLRKQNTIMQDDLCVNEQPLKRAPNESAVGA